MTADTPAEVDSQKSLLQRVVSAGFWSLLIRSGIRGVGFVRNIVLARLLSPDDFGLFGITLVVLSIMDRFSNTGLQSALVQKRTDIKDHLSTAWTVQALRGVFLSLILVSFAPYIGGFFDEPRAVPLIQVLGLIVFLQGLQNPGVLYYKRELDFRPQFIQRFGGTLSDLFVSIIFALIWQNVWALMLGLTIGSIARLIFSFTLHPFRPRIRIEISKARELGRYGRWVFLNNALFFLAYRGDNLIVGKMLGAPALGVYMMAYSISEVVTVEVSRLMTEIAFPAYSRIQERKELLQRAFLMSVELTVAIAVPVTCMLILLAKPITDLLLGSRWTPVAAVLPFLAIAGCMRALISTGGVVFNATGKPMYTFLTSLVGVGVTYALIFPLMSRYGLAGVAVAVAAGQIAMLFPFFAYTRQTLGLSTIAVVRRMGPALGIGSATGAGMFIPQFIWAESSDVSFFAAAGLGIIVYMGLSFALWKSRNTGPAALVNELISRARRKGVGVLGPKSIPAA